MKKIVTLVAGFVSIITAVIISNILVINKFGGFWNFSTSKFQPIDHFTKLVEIWNESTLLCVFIFLLIIMGMFFILKSRKVKI